MSYCPVVVGVKSQLEVAQVTALRSMGRLVPGLQAP